MWRKAAIPMIVILGCLEVNTKVLDNSIETAVFGEYRESLKIDGIANGVLAAMQSGARFSYKDKQKFIDLFIKLINRLCLVSQLYLRTKKQKELSEVSHQTSREQSVELWKSLDFIEMVLTKNQEKQKRNKKRVRSKKTDALSYIV